MDTPIKGPNSVTSTHFGELTTGNIVEKIRNGDFFSAVKLNHGFWEFCVRMRRQSRGLNFADEMTEAQWSELATRFAKRWPVTVFCDVRRFLKQAHLYPRILNLASEYGWRDGWRIERTPIEGLEETRFEIRDAISPAVPVYDGLFWKEAVYNGEFEDFISEIRNRPVIVAAPGYAKHFPEFARLKNYRYIEVHETHAGWQLDTILTAMRSAREELGGKGVIVLIEAGGLNSAWIIYRLYNEFKASFMFSLGQILNICNFSSMDRVNWFIIYREKVCETIRKINPDWIYNPLAYGGMENCPKETLRFSWKMRCYGYDLMLFPHLLERQEAMSRSSNENGKVDFIENKPIDFDLLENILSTSRENNHWANFGPVSKILESSLALKMGINQDKRVVVCKSATEALHGLARLNEIKAKRRLKWVVSALGFFSTKIGPLADALLVDCNAKGMLDIDSLKSLPENSWDAVMVTNVFGLCQDISPYVNLCREKNKILVMDNAQAFLTCTRTMPEAPCEAVSFHQTKPWGVGEGGCAVVHAEDEETFRALLNFGVGIEKDHRQNFTNGKISDFDSALILQRLITMPKWQRLYRLQARRINSIAKEKGLIPLAEHLPENIHGHLPFLAPFPVSKEMLNNPWITLRKYYQPLDEGFSVAEGLYSRIVNIPCHPELASVKEETIRRLTDHILKRF